MSVETQQLRSDEPPRERAAPPRLSLKHRLFLFSSTLVPPLGVAAAIVLLWNHLVGWSDLLVLGVFYVVTGLGMSLGFHRLFSHRSFKASSGLRLFLAVTGTMAAHGPPVIWVAHHRRHHRFADQEGDPHSPHVPLAQGRFGALRDLWRAHAGWRFKMDSASNPVRYAPDLLRDPVLVWISRHYLSLTILGLVLPGLLGFALTGRLEGALTGVVWGGLVRIFLGHHVVYAVNSLGHFYGPRRFETRDESRNLAWLAVPTFGDSWHNNHHAFPMSASHGLRWWEIDVSAMLLRVLERAGLVWDVVRIPREQQVRRLAN